MIALLNYTLYQTNEFLRSNLVILRTCKSGRFLCVAVWYRSIMRITVLQQTVSHVADLQQVLVVLLLHSSVNSPAHHLHSSLCPILNIVPD